MVITRKVVLLTGGARGLGMEIAHNLVRHGHYVVILDIQKFGILPDAHRAEITDYFEVDLSDLRAVNTIIDKVLTKYRRIDVLINNAALRLFRNFCEFSESEIQGYINVNFKTPVMLTKKIYPYMKKNGYGRIINITSVSALSGYSLGSMYCSTKCALNIFTESLGKEISAMEKVTINAICPDSFATIEGVPIHKPKKMIESINKAVDELMDTDRNGEIIVIASRKTICLNTLVELKKRLLWLIRN